MGQLGQGTDVVKVQSRHHGNHIRKGLDLGESTVSIGEDQLGLEPC